MPDLDSTTVVSGVRVPDRRRRYLAAGAGAVVLAIVVIAIAVRARSSGGTPVAAATPDAAIEADAADVVVDAAEPAPPPDAEPEIEIEPDEVPAAGAGSAKVVRRPPPERPSAAALAKEGIQAFVRGDTKNALQAFNRAKTANPSYAPTWRGLGMVHEKLGDRGAAKAAFQRYLILAPNAPDAAQVRARMKGL